MDWGDPTLLSYTLKLSEIHQSHGLGQTMPVWFVMTDTPVYMVIRRDVVHYESRTQELKITLMNEGRCDERLKARVEEGSDSGLRSAFFSIFLF